MGSNKNKRLLSKVLLTSVVLSMVSVDAVPLFSYANDLKGEEGVTVVEDIDSPETVEETILEEGLEGEVSTDTDEGEEDNVGEERGTIKVEEVETEPTSEIVEVSKEETLPEATEEPIQQTKMMVRSIAPQSVNNYVMATDEDFSGTTNGSFIYIGKDEYVEIPHTIKGVNVTSYYNMFRDTSVKGVKSTNKNVTNMGYMFYSADTTTIDLSQFDTSGATSMTYMFAGTTNSLEYNKITHLDLRNFNTSNVTTMDAMFYNSNARVIDVSSFDTSRVTNMANMFSNANMDSLDLSNFDTSRVTNMGAMFKGEMYNSGRNNNFSEIDISHFNTSNVTSMYQMFYNSSLVELDLTGLDTSKVTNMSGLVGSWGNSFRRPKLKKVNLGGLDTSNVRDMSDMFKYSIIENIDLTGLDTSNVTDMSYMFVLATASNIKGLNTLDTTSVTNMTGMFKETNVKELDLSSFSTGSLTKMTEMFRNTEVTSIDISKFNTSKVTSMANVFMETDATSINLKGIDTSNVVDMHSMFQSSKATSLDLRGLDTSKVTDLSDMFNGSQATMLQVTGMDTSNVKSMYRMFRNTRATSLDLGSFDTSNVTSLNEMFSGSYAEELDLTSFNTTKVTDMSNMFTNSKAKKIDVSNFDTTYITDMSKMFQNSQATTIDLSSFDMSSVNSTDNMFEGAIATKGVSRSSSDAKKVNKSVGKPSTLNFVPKYVMATDEDFGGTLNGYFKYTGKDEYVEIPHSIKGVNVNSYKGMFENSSVKGVISTNKNVKDMSNMFKGSTSLELDVGSIDTTGVETMVGMFYNNKAEELDLRKFVTGKVTDMENMFRGTSVKMLDLSTFDMGKVTNTTNMVQGAKATEGYAYNKGSSDKLNTSIGKPTALKFTVWGVTTTQTPLGWTNEPVTIKVDAVSEVNGMDYIEMINQPGRNYLINSQGMRPVNANSSAVTSSAGVENGVQWVSGKDFNYSDAFGMSTYANPTFEQGKGTQFSNEFYPITGQVTYSVMVMSPKPVTIRLGWQSVMGEYVTLKPNVWTRLTSTGVAGSTDRPGGFYAPHTLNTDIPLGTKVYYKDYKIEKGAEATPWTPAPEDSTGNANGESDVYMNGTYIFRATDTKGNTKTVAHTVSNIDMTQPTAELVSSPEGWTSQDVTIYVNAADDLSGVDFITLPNGQKVTGSKVEYPVTANGDYIFKVTDKAGNETTYTETVDNIDKSVPKLTSYVGNTSWTSGAVDIEVKSEESASGIKDIELISSPLEGINLLRNSVFKGNIGDKHPEGWGGGRGDNGKGTELAELVESPWEVGGDKAYHIKVISDRYFLTNEDKMKVSPGDKITTSVYSKTNTIASWYRFHDKDGNTIEYDASKKFIQYKGDVYYYTLTVPENATHYVLARIGLGTPQNVTGEDTFGNIKVEVGEEPTPYESSLDDAPLVNNTKTYNVEDNGIYSFKSTYNNGTTSETSVNVTNIDRTKPDVNIKGNIEDWTEEESIVLDISAKDTQSGVKSITLPDGKTVLSDKATYNVTKNGDYKFIVTDNIGNETVITEKVEYMMIPYSFYIYDEKGNPVEGAEFELLRNNEYYKTDVSGSDGLVDFGRIPPSGSYRVRQVTAPGGVVIDPEDVESGDVTDPIEVVSYPRGITLPSTGTLGLLGYIGMALLAILGTLFNQKRKDKME